MDALSRKTEKEKLMELEEMLADATTLIDDAGSVSYCSELHMPMNDYISSPSRSALEPRRTQSTMIDDSFSPAGADVTASIFSSSSSMSEGLVEDAEARRHQHERHDRASRRHHRALRSSDRPRNRPDHAKATVASTAVALLRSELEATRSQLRQKEVVTKSLQRQLDQRGEIEAQTQARNEEDLVAALAKASGLKEELARTSQLLVDGALERQHLEQRCSLLTKDLRKSVARRAELEDEVSVTRAELVRISGVLHARRGTDVVEAERAFAEELQRVQENAAREARGLRQEVSGQRASLEEIRNKLQKSCGERDSWREEAHALSSEVDNLRETVHALRQYSENDTIDQLLGQVSHWKRRAEELESQQRVESSPSRSAFGTSNSETEASLSTEPAGPSAFPREESGALLATVDQARLDEKGEEERQGSEGEVAKVAKDALRQDLSETKETLAMMTEELAMVLSMAREETGRRVAAENRVQSLQAEAEANAKAAREDFLARRAAKARDMAKMKLAIQQDMVDELYKLQREVKGQSQENKVPTIHGATPATRRGEDKMCQVDGRIMTSAEDVGQAAQANPHSRVRAACSACGVDLVGSAGDGMNVVGSPTVAWVLEEEVKKLLSAAVASAAVAQVGAKAWASAFFAATHLIHAALSSLCEQSGGLRSDVDGQPAFVVAPLAGVKAPGSNKESSSGIVITWMSRQANGGAAMAFEALRGSVKAAVEAVRSAAEGRARTVPRSTSVTAGSQTFEESPPITATTAISQSTIGSQTDCVPEREVGGSRQHHTGVQSDRLEQRSAEGVSGACGTGGAPAWEGGVDGRCFEGEREDGQRERQRGGQRERLRRVEDERRMKKLERTAYALSEALQRAEMEKGSLELALTQREREQEKQLKRQKDVFEADIRGLYASAMALVRDFSSGNSWTLLNKD